MKLKHLFFTLAALVFFSTAQAQVKIGANTSTIETISNLEVEAANGNKTIVNKATGQVTIQDGTQGAGKVLTSDSTGASSWQTIASQNTPVAFSVKQVSSGQQVPANSQIVIAFSTKTFDKGSNFSTTTNRFTVPSVGYYILTVTGGNLATLVPTGTVYGQNYILQKNGANYRTIAVSSITAQSGYYANGTAYVYAQPGDYFTVAAYSNIATSAVAGFIFEGYKVSN